MDLGTGLIRMLDRIKRKFQSNFVALKIPVMYDLWNLSPNTYVIRLIIVIAENVT